MSTKFRKVTDHGRPLSESAIREAVFCFISSNLSRVKIGQCSAENVRESSSLSLCRYIDVDIYGTCGRHSCVKEENGCRRMLSADYKFYLAFENSNCVEYITEKPGFQALL
jgi:hypothetical protein